MKRTKIQLKLSPEDQKELNYQNPNLEWDFEELMGHSWTTSTRPIDIIQAIKKDINIPDAYLNEYRVEIWENVLLVMK